MDVFIVVAHLILYLFEIYYFFYKHQIVTLMIPDLKNNIIFYLVVKYSNILFKFVAFKPHDEKYLIIIFCTNLRILCSRAVI